MCLFWQSKKETWQWKCNLGAQANPLSKRSWNASRISTNMSLFFFLWSDTSAISQSLSTKTLFPLTSSSSQSRNVFKGKPTPYLPPVLPCFFHLVAQLLRWVTNTWRGQLRQLTCVRFKCRLYQTRMFHPALQSHLTAPWLMRGRISKMGQSSIIKMMEEWKKKRDCLPQVWGHEYFRIPGSCSFMKSFIANFLSY